MQSVPLKLPKSKIFKTKSGWSPLNSNINNKYGHDNRIFVCEMLEAVRMIMNE